MERRRIVCAALAAMLVPSAVRADEISEIIVSARRTQPLDLAVSVGKTNTPIVDIPRSIQIVPRALLDDQGATKLTDSLSNVSGATQGGQFAFGFYDRIIIRGLNATQLTDGLPDAPSELGGIPHSLTGVERVEILKGPGSALYGGGEQGGTMNLVHYKPSDRFSAFASEQYGTFDTSTTTGGITGPTGVAGVDFRVDGTYDRSDGFRARRTRTAEILPALSWRPEDHDIEARLEYRDLKTRPDAAGIPFSPPAAIGLPAPVSSQNIYYTPFARGNQEIVRFLISDVWSFDRDLTINNRFSYTSRSVDIARNGGGTVALLGSQYGLRGRQLRRQTDDSDDYLYQIEPNYHFDTGSVKHNVLGGFQFQKIDGHTQRATADLPNIASLSAPVIPEQSESALSFLCNAAHSCNDADISGRFLGVYLTDQIDLTDTIRVRLSGREDWFKTSGVATSNIPLNPGMQQPCDPPQLGVQCPWVQGVPVRRKDHKFSWDAGVVYFVMPGVSVFGGASSAHYPIFNTEEPQTIGGAPESGDQYEGGARFAFAQYLTLTTSVYQVKRDAIFTVLVDPQTGLDVPTAFAYRVRGWEVDVNSSPLQHWNIVANFSRQSPRISDYPQSQANVGHLVPSVPKLLANAWTSYDIILGDTFGIFRLKAGVRYRGRTFADANNTRILPGSTVADSGVEWLKGPLGISLGVNNMFDRKVWLGGAGAGGGAIPGQSRTYFARVSLKTQ